MSHSTQDHHRVGSSTAATAASLPALPAGFRALSAGEGDTLETGVRVLVYDRGLQRVIPYTVVGYHRRRGWHVAIFANGEAVDTLWLDDDESDDPDAFVEASNRRGPQTIDGAYVAVTVIDRADLAALLRESVPRAIAQECLDRASDASERAV